MVSGSKGSSAVRFFVMKSGSPRDEAIEAGARKSLVYGGGEPWAS